jgi:hypothetical protein
VRLTILSQRSALARDRGKGKSRALLVSSVATQTSTSSARARRLGCRIGAGSSILPLPPSHGEASRTCDRAAIIHLGTERPG